MSRTTEVEDLYIDGDWTIVCDFFNATVTLLKAAFIPLSTNHLVYYARSITQKIPYEVLTCACATLSGKNPMVPYKASLIFSSELGLVFSHYCHAF